MSKLTGKYVNVHNLLDHRCQAKQYSEDMYVIGQGYLMGDHNDIEEVTIVRCCDCDKHSDEFVRDNRIDMSNLVWCSLLEDFRDKNEFCSRGSLKIEE